LYYALRKEKRQGVRLMRIVPSFAYSLACRLKKISSSNLAEFRAAFGDAESFDRLYPYELKAIVEVSEVTGVGLLAVLLCAGLAESRDDAQALRACWLVGEQWLEGEKVERLCHALAEQFPCQTQIYS